MTGIIAIDKSSGIVSRRVTSAVSRLVGEKKAGHAGTLDPMASGVLPIMLGRACKLLPFIEEDKRYTAKVLFGIKTDTADMEGTVIEKNDIMPQKDLLLCATAQFVGEITQLPPLYSAIKKDGRPLYDYARHGIAVEREERVARIYNITLLEYDGQGKTCLLDIACGSGTYIRTLCEDIAQRCGAICTLAALRRTRAGGIDISDCMDMNTLEKRINSNDDSFLLTAEKIFRALNSVKIPDNGLMYYLSGGSIGMDRLGIKLSDKIYRAYSQDGRFLGLSGRVDDFEQPLIKSVWLEEI